MKPESGSLYVRIIVPCLVFVLFTSLWNCSYQQEKVTADLSLGKDALPIHTIAVIPFQKITSPDPAAPFVRCPLSGKTFKTCDIPGEPETIIQTLLLQRLLKTGAYKIVPEEKTQEIYARILNGPEALPSKELIMEVGKELQADAVVAGYIFRYRERKGYSYSIERPALVTFALYLVRVKDGALIWKGIVDKTQTSLMEDLSTISSFIKEKGKWVTAKRLAEEGINEAFKTFPQFPQ